MKSPLFAPVPDTMRVRVVLFGQFKVEVDGQDLERRLEEQGAHARGKALLVLLILALQGGEPMRRRELADLVWEGYGIADDTVNTRKAYLRSTLYELRKALGEAAESLQTDNEFAALREVDVDVWQFREAAARGDRGSLEGAVVLFERGELFPEVRLQPDQHALQAWLDAQRAELRAMFETCQERLQALQRQEDATRRRLRTRAAAVLGGMVALLLAWCVCAPILVRADDKATEYHNQAYKLREQGRYREAMVLWQKVLQLRPGWVLPMADLAELYAFDLPSQPNQRVAVSLFNQVLEVNP